MSSVCWRTRARDRENVTPANDAVFVWRERTRFKKVQALYRPQSESGETEPQHNWKKRKSLLHLLCACFRLGTCRCMKHFWRLVYFSVPFHYSSSSSWFCVEEPPETSLSARASSPTTTATTTTATATVLPTKMSDCPAVNKKLRITSYQLFIYLFFICLFSFYSLFIHLWLFILWLFIDLFTYI